MLAIRIIMIFIKKSSENPTKLGRIFWNVGDFPINSIFNRILVFCVPRDGVWMGHEEDVAAKLEKNRREREGTKHRM